jgi:hypothetical protein
MNPVNISKPQLIQEADLITLQKLFTTIVRADRFCEGFMKENIDNGVILNLLLRLESIMDKTIDRSLGAILGLAVGDSMGMPLEFSPPGTFKPVNDMIGGGPFNLDPGMWTDDTSLALCLAESLTESEGFDPIDQLTRYTRWLKDGHLSVNGKSSNWQHHPPGPEKI